MNNYTLRLLESPTDHKRLEAIQTAIWGEGMAIVYDQTLTACKYGGIAVGAFADEALIGFCYSWPAFAKGDVWLHSHLLGVLPAHRSAGLGAKIKEAQRQAALAAGYTRMTWTYDPLEAPNARLNLSKLKGTVRQYDVNYYGDLEDDLNRGLPTDRLMVEWDLLGPTGGCVAPDDALVINPTPLDWIADLTAPIIRLALPTDMRTRHTAGDLPYVLAWRMHVRAALQHYLALGYEAAGFADGHYALRRYT